MPRYARFAALSLSLLALPLLAADLRPIEDPAEIATVFPRVAKVRLLNIWAMWCVPCVEEMPDLRAIDAAFGGELAMAGVTLDDMLPDADARVTARFLDQHQIRFPNVFFTGNADALGEHLRFNGAIPMTIIYDRKGKELWRHLGRLDRKETTAILREALRRTE